MNREHEYDNFIIFLKRCSLSLRVGSRSRRCKLKQEKREALLYLYHNEIIYVLEFLPLVLSLIDVSKDGIFQKIRLIKTERGVDAFNLNESI